MFCPYFVGPPVWLVSYNHSHCQERVKTQEQHQMDCCYCYLHCYCGDCLAGISLHQRVLHLGDLLGQMVVWAIAGDHHQNTMDEKSYLLSQDFNIECLLSILFARLRINNFMCKSIMMVILVNPYLSVWISKVYNINVGFGMIQEFL